MNPANPPQGILGTRGRHCRPPLHYRALRRVRLAALCLLAAIADAQLRLADRRLRLADRRLQRAIEATRAIPPEPPALRAHESISMSHAALLKGLAALHAEEWGP